MTEKKNIYFLSDAHLGTPDFDQSLEREKKLVKFLDSIKDRASEIFLLGDIFDFWYEYKHVTGRGYTRFLGKIAELNDQLIPVHFFTGNHDIWISDYLPRETGMIIHRKPTVIERSGKTFYLAHGDGMDEKDTKYKIIKHIFHNRFLQWCFSRLHPNFAYSLAFRWSKRSRLMNGVDPFKGEQEPAVIYSRTHLLDKGYDYIVTGHRHCSVDFPLNKKTRFIILGDWLNLFTYGIFDGQDFTLKEFD